MFARRGYFHVPHDFAAEFGVTLCGEPDAEGLCGDWPEAILIDARARALQ